MNPLKTTSQRPLALRPLHRIATMLVTGLLVGLLSVCGAADDGDSMQSTATVFEGAKVVVGGGSAAIENASIVVDNGRITQVGPRDDVQVPEGAAHVDLAGKTILPALINTHMHLGTTRDELVPQLQHLAYYGVGAAVSLGSDAGDQTLELRAEVIPDGPRFLNSDPGITRPEPGRNEVPHWVDDRGGRYEKLTPELFGAIIDEAHRHDLQVTAHMYPLSDAKSLLLAGVDAFAHSVRDRDVDNEFVTLVRERPDFVLVPNLPNPGIVTDLS